MKNNIKELRRLTNLEELRRLINLKKLRKLNNLKNQRNQLTEKSLNCIFKDCSVNEFYGLQNSKLGKERGCSGDIFQLLKATFHSNSLFSKNRLFAPLEDGRILVSYPIFLRIGSYFPDFLPLKQTSLNFGAISFKIEN